MKVSFKLYGIGFIFVFIIITMFLATLFTTGKQKDDSLLINLAGRQRMLSQKMTKELYLYLARSDRKTSLDQQASAEQVRATMKTFAMTLSALKDSGRAPLSINPDNTQYADCPAVKGPAHAQLVKVGNLWEKFVPVMEKALAGKASNGDLAFIASGNVDLLREMNKAVTMMQKNSEKSVHRLITEQKIFVVAALAFAFIAFFIIRYITRSLEQVVDTMSRLENGDMTARMDIRTKDEIGRLATAANQLANQFGLNLIKMRGASSTTGSSTKILHSLVKKLSTTAVELADNAANVSRSAEEMNGNMAAIAAASEETSINVSQVASGADQMSMTITEIADNSKEAIRITDEAVTEAASAEESVRALGNAAQEISKVTESINEIADQTNLLALNATIEAARAGEAGKGFAVVANEIKELAKQTTEATKEIKERIEGVQLSSEQTIGVINTITSTINKTNKIVLSMATAVQEQAASSREIADNVNQASAGIQEVNENIAHASTVNSEVTREVAEINSEANSVAAHATDIYELAVELQSNAEALKTEVERFTFKDELFAIGEIKAAHFQWKMKLSSVIAGYQQIEENEVVDHHQCSFGKWYDHVPEELKSIPVYAELGRHHEAVHAKIREAVVCRNRNDLAGAEQKIAEFEEERKKLFKNLDELYSQV